MTKMMPVTVRTNIDKSKTDLAGVDSGAKMLVSVAGSSAIALRRGKPVASGIVCAPAAGCCVGSASYERGSGRGLAGEQAVSAHVQTSVSIYKHWLTRLLRKRKAQGGVNR